MSEAKAIARIDPQALLTRAVEGNASVETLERLFALAKDVREVQAREAWNEAMAEFQRRCPPIKKTKTAEIVTAKGFYKYSYAPLDEIVEIIRPLLGELGLSISWSSRVEPSRVIVSCRIAHVLGYAENSGEISMPIPDASDRGGGNPAQRVGSALTYARRYSLLQVTGLAPEDDDDADSLGPSHTTTREPETPQESPSRAGKPIGNAIVFPFGKHKDMTPSELPLDDLQRELTFWQDKTAKETNERFKAHNQKLVDAIQDAIEKAKPPVEEPHGDPKDIACQEWCEDFWKAESLDTLSAKWKHVQDKRIWTTFDKAQQDRMEQAKDKRKDELQQQSGKLV